MKKFGVALLAVLVVNSSLGAEWVETSNDTEFTGYLDSNSVRKITDTEIIYFIKEVFKSPQNSENGETFTYDIYKMKGDYTENRVSQLGYTAYDSNGNSVESEDFSQDDWQTIYPDSIGESELNSACQVAGYR